MESAVFPVTVDDVKPFWALVVALTLFWLNPSSANRNGVGMENHLPIVKQADDPAFLLSYHTGGVPSFAREGWEPIIAASSGPCLRPKPARLFHHIFSVPPSQTRTTIGAMIPATLRHRESRIAPVSRGGRICLLFDKLRNETKHTRACPEKTTGKSNLLNTLPLRTLLSST